MLLKTKARELNDESYEQRRGWGRVATPWYEQSFQEDYLLIYKHRNIQNAEVEVRAMSDILQLPLKAKVLDLCCGSGRHAFILHQLGYDVTGVDLSETLLKAAQSADSAKSIRWVRGDMRSIPLEESFDAIFNLFTSFGYFATDDENIQVLEEIHRLLKADGQFIIDFLNPAYVAAHLIAYSKRQEEGIIIEEFREISSSFVMKRIELTPEQGAKRTYHEQVKLYSLKQFESMFASAGLKLESVYGGYDGTEYREQHSPRLIMVGRKRGLAIE
jgi:SAM-dependent methyltransferase